VRGCFFGDRADRDSTPKYEIRIARRLFEDGRDDRWRETVCHEVAHAYVLELSVLTSSLTVRSGRARPDGRVRIRSLATRVTRSSTRNTSF
jgi:hypothetical protein